MHFIIFYYYVLLVCAFNLSTVPFWIYFGKKNSKNKHITVWQMSSAALVLVAVGSNNFLFLLGLIANIETSSALLSLVQNFNLLKSTLEDLMKSHTGASTLNLLSSFQLYLKGFGFGFLNNCTFNASLKV